MLPCSLARYWAEQADRGSVIKRLRMIMIWVLAIAALLAAAVAAYIHLPGGSARLEAVFTIKPQPAVDFATLRKGPKPNQYLVCPPSTCAEQPDRAAPVYPLTVEGLRQAWDRVVAAQPDVAVLERDNASDQLTYVQRTRLMRFPDLITVRFVSQASGGASMAIYSRSLYGYSDRGVNKARIDQWLEQLDKEVGNHAP